MLVVAMQCNASNAMQCNATCTCSNKDCHSHLHTLTLEIKEALIEEALIEEAVSIQTKSCTGQNA